MPRALALVPVALLALAPLARAQRARAGELYELVVLDAATSTRVSDVGAGGQGVGLRVVAGVSRAFVWSAAAGEVPRAPLAGYPWSLGLRTNRDGFVLGTSFSAAATVATLWSPAGTALELPHLGWTISSPMALADDGVVVGNGLTGGGWRPWIWDATNGTRDLVALGLPAGCTVADVNTSGVVAASPAFGEAFLFDLATATSVPLGTLGGDSSAVRALAESGHAAGSSWTAASNDPSPFFWSPATGMRSLGTTAGPGFVVGAAHALNEHDVVVGRFEVVPGRDHAFVWDEHLGLRDLNTLVRRRGGVELEEAHGISARGWIAGNATDHGAGGKSVGFLLKPL